MCAISELFPTFAVSRLHKEKFDKCRIILPRVEKIRPRILSHVIVGVIAHIWNEILDVENVGSTNVGWKLDVVCIEINLLDDLNGNNRLRLKFVVVVSRNAFLSENGPYTIANVEVDRAMILVRRVLVSSCSFFEVGNRGAVSL